MAKDEGQLERFRDAVDRKARDAEEASHRQPARGTPDEGIEGDQASLREAGRPPDVFSVRDKSSGHGKKTADKWNQ
jgi:hypothetical protein